MFAGSAAGSGGHADGTGSAASFSALEGVSFYNNSIFVCDYGNGLIRMSTLQGTTSTYAGAYGLTGSTNGPRLTATFNMPVGITVDKQGNLIISQWGNHLIRGISPFGVVYTIAGSGVQGVADGAGNCILIISIILKFLQP